MRCNTISYIRKGTDDRICAITQLIRPDCSEESCGDVKVLYKAKQVEVSDREAARLWKMMEKIFALRKTQAIFLLYKMIDTCASEFESYIPYFYSACGEKMNPSSRRAKRFLPSVQVIFASVRALSLITFQQTFWLRCGDQALCGTV